MNCTFMDCHASRTKTVGIKKLASGRIFGFAKPAASRLRAEVPWNYILGRLAAALQSVFETHPAPSRHFFICNHELPKTTVKDGLRRNPFLYICGFYACRAKRDKSFLCKHSQQFDRHDAAGAYHFFSIRFHTNLLNSFKIFIIFVKPI